MRDSGHQHFSIVNWFLLVHLVLKLLLYVNLGYCLIKMLDVLAVYGGITPYPIGYIISDSVGVSPFFHC